MAYGNKGGYSKGRSGGGFNHKRDDRRGGFSHGPKQMHDATCGKCGNDCQVPFRPTGERPVLCSNCFEKNSGRGERSFDRDRAPRGGDRPFKKEFSASKPDVRIDALQKEVRNLHQKVDQLLAALVPESVSVDTADDDIVTFGEIAPIDVPVKKKKVRIIPDKGEAVEALFAAKEGGKPKTAETKKKAPAKKKVAKKAPAKKKATTKKATPTKTTKKKTTTKKK